MPRILSRVLKYSIVSHWLLVGRFFFSGTLRSNHVVGGIVL